jgi:hypothetical protein
VLDERGTRSQAVQGYAYDPEESYVDVRAARVLRADGSIEEIGKTRVFSLAEAGYRMYYDQRQIQVQFPGLRVGDTIEVAFVRRDVASRNKFDDYFGDILPLEGTDPIEHMEYRLEVPSGMQLHFNAPVRESVEKKKGKGGSTVYRVVLEDVPGLRPESNMPGWTELARYLHVSTYATWDEVGTWYWGFVEEQLQVDDAIRGGVAEALEGLPSGASESDKIAALYRHVIRKTRYVGLEFGVHGYKPYRTTDVYARKFGDCKDKASLLKVMLAEIGVKSHLVLVRTRDQGTIDSTPASLSAFNHAIVYLPKYDLFLDGTAEFSGVSELPVGDQGASVLIVLDGKGGDFRTIPVSKVVDNIKDIEQRVKLSETGSAQVEHRMQLTGAGASTWRVGFQSEENRKERLTEVFGSSFPGTEVRSLSLPRIGDVLAPVELRASLSVPSWGQARDDPERGKSLRFKVAGHASSLTNRLAPQKKREHPLVLTAPSREVHTIHYQVPRGMKLTQLPSERSIDTKHGRFHLEVEKQGTGATVKTTLEFPDARIEPGEYKSFREFLRQVDASLEQAFEAEAAR